MMSPRTLLGNLIRKWWFIGRAPIPVYDLSDEDVDQIEAERARRKDKPKGA